MTELKGHTALVTQRMVAALGHPQPHPGPRNANVDPKVKEGGAASCHPEGVSKVR